MDADQKQPQTGRFRLLKKTEAGHGKHQPEPEQSDIAGLACRQVAMRLLAAVVERKTSLDGLTDNDHGHPQYRALAPRDRALVRAILGTALRNRGVVSAALKRFLDRPLPENARALLHLLHISAAQIVWLDVPDHAAIYLAVEAAKQDPRLKRFAGLVNAVLRRFAKQAERIRTDNQPLDNCPPWFGTLLTQAYGQEKAGAILRIQAQEPPLDLTVRSEPEIWAQKLGGHVLPNGTVRLAELSAPLTELPGFAEGEWWVQDVAASLPARLMGQIAGQRVADLCAAPGGKTAQLALAGAKVTAVDLSASRLQRLVLNMARLHLSVETWAGDMRKWQPEQLFDAVLLDAPCSSTGTIRRHPDILWTKDEADVQKLAGVQADLLDHAVRLVRPGGTVVFSNCSLSRQEGEELIRAFVDRHANVQLLPVQAADGGTAGPGHADHAGRLCAHDTG
ncbi:MAG: Ribosomal RNA small subunit methyltransferase B [Candidatus Tokpelaia hoelldobleri]|uniref:Ribosomal RNA small subunit methyltransferase B n=1 Tax=Candidatus Tokpelaia hoelldobleri TaxID=1902579 RepID=A0A1U9JWS4_9HYPH|nr:MAG: Ribosomal RNA small subunit methyltransferase B [Candidatus Tokpelaia hoelldoblerii]